MSEEVIKVKKKKSAPKSAPIGKPPAEKKPLEKKEKEVTDGHWIDEWL